MTGEWYTVEWVWGGWRGWGGRLLGFHHAWDWLVGQDWRHEAWGRGAPRSALIWHGSVPEPGAWGGFLLTVWLVMLQRAFFECVETCLFLYLFWMVRLYNKGSCLASVLQCRRILIISTFWKRKVRSWNILYLSLPGYFIGGLFPTRLFPPGYTCCSFM